ncbi:MAG: hypothetical protein LBN39_05965 [Planctomycetaceae bacterium]|jgi:hypothetical protein|nr:hypothetical protein [Planctomycetaceae bacterium]
MDCKSGKIGNPDTINRYIPVKKDDFPEWNAGLRIQEAFGDHHLFRGTPMKRTRKNTQRTLATALLGFLIFGAGSFTANAAAPSVQYELVPHIVLPDTIQYNGVAANTASPSCLNHAADYGVVSPFVATYSPFPALQLPKPLPQKETETKRQESEQKELAVAEPQEPEKLILQASNNEEIVPATPLMPLNQDITQTGIFCQKPAKPPAAWSFNSPVFKAASVPMPWGGQPGFNGYINQFGARGTGSQIGFIPQGGQPGAVPPAMGGIPYQAFGTGGGYDPSGVQTQVLPNGMVLLTAPADHSGCGLLRCHGSTPRMMILPGSPGMMTPATQLPALPQPGMAPPPVPQIPQGTVPDASSFYGVPQMQPITAMTPYGLAVVGYRPTVPYLQYQPYQNPYSFAGMGTMPAAQWQQLQQLQAAQQSATELAKDGTKSEGTGEQSGELRPPLSINPQFANGIYANPFALYAAQAEAAAAAGQPNSAAAGTAAANGLTPPPAADGFNPLFFQFPQQLPPQFAYGYPQQYQQPVPYPTVYQTPFGLVPAAQPQPFNPMYGGYSPYGFQQPGFMPVGFGGASGAGFQQGGMSMSEVLQLVMLLRDNQPRRKGLFSRIADRRAERRERHSGGDPLAQLMQAWSTPYNPDSTLRMPVQNAYPYGYFGAQAGPQDTANYGGYYNLYMGNTSYPGLY